MSKSNNRKLYYTKRSIALSYLALGGLSLVLAVLRWKSDTTNFNELLGSQEVLQILQTVGNYGGIALLGVLFISFGIWVFIKPSAVLYPQHLVLKGKKTIDYKDIKDVEDQGPDGLYLHVRKSGEEPRGKTEGKTPGDTEIERVKILDTIIDKRQEFIAALANKLGLADTLKELKRMGDFSVDGGNRDLRADSKIRSQDRGRRGTRPVRRDNEDAPLGAPQLTQQVEMDRRPNPEVIFESALSRIQKTENDANKERFYGNRDIKTMSIFYVLVGLTLFLTLLLIFSAARQGTWSLPTTWKLPDWCSEYFLLLAMAFFCGYLIFQRKHSIVALTPTHLEIQTHWESSIYKIPYSTIQDVEVESPKDVFIKVAVNGEDSKIKEIRIRLPMELFHKNDQEKLLMEMRQRTN